jgi:hypothetical protein
MIMSRLSSVAGVSLVGLVAAIPLSAEASSAAPARDDVYLVQGVPGAAVDVSVDGKTVKSSVAAKAIVGPLKLTNGRHTVTFAATGWKVSSTVNVSRPSSDVVLHWPASSTQKPVVSVFGNDLASVGPDKGRLTVAHTAVVPPADIRVNNKVLFANIANGQFATAEVPADTYSVEVVPTGQTGNPLLGPVDLPVAKGVLTRVFAIGQPSNGSMDAVVQVLPVATKGSAAPGQVDAGSAGLVATSTPASSSGVSAATWGIGGTVLIGVGTASLYARRRREVR